MKEAGPIGPGKGIARGRSGEFPIWPAINGFKPPRFDKFERPPKPAIGPRLEKGGICCKDEIGGNGNGGGGGRAASCGSCASGPSVLPNGNPNGPAKFDKPKLLKFGNVPTRDPNGSTGGKNWFVVVVLDGTFDFLAPIFC